jgi:hypothetical protein
LWEKCRRRFRPRFQVGELQFIICFEKKRFDSRCCKIFWEVVGLEWGPLSS